MTTGAQLCGAGYRKIGVSREKTETYNLLRRVPSAVFLDQGSLKVP